MYKTTFYNIFFHKKKNKVRFYLYRRKFFLLITFRLFFFKEYKNSFTSFALREFTLRNLTYALCNWYGGEEQVKLRQTLFEGGTCTNNTMLHQKGAGQKTLSC